MGLEGDVVVVLHFFWEEEEALGDDLKGPSMMSPRFRPCNKKREEKFADEMPKTEAVERTDCS